MSRRVDKVRVCPCSACVIVPGLLPPRQPGKETDTPSRRYELFYILAESKTTKKTIKHDDKVACFKPLRTQNTPGRSASERRRELLVSSTRRKADGRSSSSDTAQHSTLVAKHVPPAPTRSRESTSCQWAWLTHTAAHVGSAPSAS